MRIEFNKLPRHTRERLVEATRRGSADPLVLAREPDMRTGWFKYLVLALSAAVAVGLGTAVLNRHACQEPQYMQETWAGWALALAVFWMAALTVGRRFVAGVPPTVGGRYVFPSGLVLLDDGVVEHTPLAEVKEPKLVTVLRNYRYSHTDLKLIPWFSFRFDKGPQAKAALEAILAARDLGRVPPEDPFAPCLGRESWEAPSAEQAEGPRVHLPSALFRRLRFPGGLAFGLAVAGALYAYCAALR